MAKRLNVFSLGISHASLGVCIVLHILSAVQNASQ